MNAVPLCGCGCLQPLGIYVDRIHGHWHDSAPHYTIEDRGYKTPCWIWQKSYNVWGYSRCKRGGRTMAAHKLFYEAYIGPIPEKFDIDHLCRIRGCVNPEHLEAVTREINVQRGLLGDMSTFLRHEQIVELANLYLQGYSQSQLAKMYNVGQATISRYLTGKKKKSVNITTRSPIKLSLEQVEAIRLQASAGETQRSIARKYGMGQSQIGRIVREQSWENATTME